MSHSNDKQIFNKLSPVILDAIRNIDNDEVRGHLQNAIRAMRPKHEQAESIYITKPSDAYLNKIKEDMKMSYKE